MSNQFPIERRELGRTGEKLSKIGFGGIVVMNETPSDAANWVAQAVEGGVNYFDVAPGYGNAEERLGPALRPHRDQCFLACKTHVRDGQGAQTSLENSLRLLQTDRLDLFQLHAITTVEEVDQIFAPAGVMDVILKAREQGKIRWVGFSAHSHEAALRAMEQFDFDSLLMPFNYATWFKGHFGPQMLGMATAKGMGVLALKAMAQCKWPGDLPQEKRPWPKCWYQPHDTPQDVSLALRFTLSLPGVTAALPPGHWELFKMAMELAQRGELETAPTDEELAQLQAMAEPQTPVFERPAA